MAGETRAFSFPAFKWWVGVVEDNKDPEELGRLRVRVYGYHTDDLGQLPTDKLAWATVSNNIQSSSLSGLGASPTGIVAGTTCWGFFLDGESAEVPIIVGTLPGKPDAPQQGQGFADPSGKYPDKPGESDVNRLSRGKTNGTVIEKMISAVKTAAGAFGRSWTEPKSKYGAKYPWNHVFESLAGHVFEVDDTEGKERLHRHHKSGTFEEVHPDGTVVTKVVKKRYTLVADDDHLYVEGNCHITVNGNADVLVKGNADLEVLGNMKEHIGGNYEMTVDGSATWKVQGDWARSSGTHISDDAATIDHN